VIGDSGGERCYSCATRLLFAREEWQELRWAFDGLQPVAMTDVTLAQDLVCGNVRYALTSRLRGGRCRVFGSNRLQFGLTMPQFGACQA
jgi:hypothetical protein